MATAEVEVPPLVNGQRLTRDEFLRRWEAMPNVKYAELIKGVVRMPSPLGLDHGRSDYNLAGLFFVYTANTPGTQGANSATSLMLDDAPQPDIHVRILPEAGGRTQRSGKFLAGGPELIAEISHSSASYDLGDKFELYDEAGVLEYVVVLIEEREIRWFHRQDGKLQPAPEPPDGIWRSQVFPGLWLDGSAFLAGDIPKVLATMNQGIISSEHAAFVQQLANRMKT